MLTARDVAWYAMASIFVGMQESFCFHTNAFELKGQHELEVKMRINYWWTEKWTRDHAGLLVKMVNYSCVLHGNFRIKYKTMKVIAKGMRCMYMLVVPIFGNRWLFVSIRFTLRLHFVFYIVACRCCNFFF